MSESTSPRSDDPRLLSLLSAWYSRRVSGAACPPEELCPDDPGLLVALRGRIGAIERLERLADSQAGASTDDPDRTAPRFEAGEQAVPETLGRFRILAKLGEGAFGEVYRAHDPQLDREVALKVAKSAALDSEERVQRFLREARAAANLRHPNVVPVHDSGTAGGRHFIATGFIDGRTLQAEIKELGGRPADPQRAAGVVRRLAEALGYAHSKGVVHRDVKPANVLVDQTGDVLVADFGLATRAGDDAVQTQDGGILGTPAYMSPEQAAGRSREATAASDQYALGVILYEMLAGKRPFDGPSQSVIVKHIHDLPLSPRATNPAVPLDLETVCLKCLAKDPAARYPSCEALADDLRRWQAGEPITARRLTPAERFARWVRRKPTQAALVVLIPLVFGLTAVAALLAVLKGQADTARDAADQLKGDAISARDGEKTQREQAESARDREQALRKELAEQDAVRKTDLAFRAAGESNAMRAARLLDEVDPAHRNWEWRHTAHLIASDVRRLRTDGLTGYVSGLAVTADGKRVFAVCPEGVRSWDPFTGVEQITYRGHGAAKVRAVALFRDQKRAVSAAADGSIHVWDAATGERRRAIPTPVPEVVAMTVSGDGKWLAVGESAGGIAVWDADSGERRSTLKGHAGRVNALAFLPDGRLVSGGQDGTVRVWDVAAEKPLAPPAKHDGPVWAVTPGPDGKQVWATDEYGYVATWAADDLKPVGRFRAHRNRACCLSFAADGRAFVTGGMDQTAKVWRVGHTGEPVGTFRGHVDDVNAARLLPDGKHLVTTGDDTVRVWDLSRREGARVVPADRAALRVRFSPDGRWVAALVNRPTAQGGVGAFARVWDANTGEPLAGWPIPSASALAFRPDGKALVCGGPGGKLMVWPLDDTGEAKAWTAHRGQMTALAVTGDRVVSVGRDGQLRLADLTTGAAVWSVPLPAEVTDVCVSPDGATVATAGADRTVRLWDAATGKETRALTGHTPGVVHPPGVAHTHVVLRVSFDRDGKRLASASADNTVRVWDVATGEQVHRLRTHAHFIHGVSFGPHGRLADACGDSTLTLYDARTGQETITLRGHTDQVTDVAFSPDGGRLASTSLDGTVRLWDAPLDARVELPAHATGSFDPK